MQVNLLDKTHLINGNMCIVLNSHGIRLITWFYPFLKAQGPYIEVMTHLDRHPNLKVEKALQYHSAGLEGEFCVGPFHS